MTQDHQHPENNPIVDEYSRLALDYDSKWSFYVNATTRETIRRLKMGPTDRVLDVGCGTGALLYRLASSSPKARLVGLDLVPEMLAIARRRLPSGLELREGSAEQLPFEDEQFDLVVSCNMFHYIRHPKRAIQEMLRVLRPGGQLLITDWCDDYIACCVCDLYLRLFNRAHFKTYGAKECGRLLREAGVAEVKVERFKISWLWGLMTASGRRDGNFP